MNQSLFCTFWGAEGLAGSRAAHAIPSPLCVPAVPGVSLPVPARAPGAVRAEPLPTPACRTGCEPQGPPGATHRVWDGEQSRRFTSRPTPADFLLGVFTIFPRRLPMGTSQGETPAGLPAGTGEEVSSSSTCWSCCLSGAQL